MKNKWLFGFTLLVAGALIAFGPLTIIKVCDWSKMQMRCYYSSRAEIGIGIILMAAGVLYFLLEHWQARIVIGGIGIITGIVAVLIPSFLIGGCGDSRMACQSLSFPAIYLISGITILAALGNSISIYTGRRKQ